MSESLAKALTAVKGGAKFAAAILTGDVADDQLAGLRRESCLACPSRVRITVGGASAESDWCGDPFAERLDEPQPTCGCLLAGKVRVASEKCPQGRW
jgi:hypothetical protein